MATGRSQVTLEVQKNQPCQVKEFGANGKLPQTAATVNAAVVDTSTVDAPAGGTGAAAGAWDTSAHRDAAIAVINANRADIVALTALVNQLRAQLVACGLCV